MYSLFLEVWLRHLPRSHVLVLKAEDYFVDAMGTLQKVGAGVGAAEEGGKRGWVGVLARWGRGQGTNASAYVAQQAEREGLLNKDGERMKSPLSYLERIISA